MADQRRKDVNWNVVTEANCYQTDSFYKLATAATLMDIRDELKRLNSLLHCQNFISIPSKLDRINHNIPKRRRRRRTKG